MTEFNLNKPYNCPPLSSSHLWNNLVRKKDFPHLRIPVTTFINLV